MLKLLNKEFLIILFLVFIINVPKINILPIGTFLQGIRLDDILILIYVLFNIRNIEFTKTGLIIFFFITISFLLSFFHQPLTLNTYFTIFHYLRFIEYFFLYSVLEKNFNVENIIKIIIITFLIQFCYTLATKINPTLSFAKEYGLHGRASGTMAGPWELALVFGMFFFVLYDYLVKKKNSIKLIFFNSLTWLIIILATSRIALVGFLSAFIYKNFKYLIIIFPPILFLLMITNYHFVFFENIELGYFAPGKVINFLSDFTIPIINNFKEGYFFIGRNGTFYDPSALNYDPSLVSRLQHWGEYLNAFNNSTNKFIAIVFGNGPGSMGIYCDGWYIKLFTDFGIIGTLLYFYLVIKYFYNYKNLRYFIIFVLVTSITIDFYWPTKIAYTFILCIIYFQKKYFKKLNLIIP